ncbi:carboxylating nicotinate-nucleotide diphosphorylase [Congregibacter litoralis]|uniref:Probable nicotinate-nucleotide pyrophosphorylase [carboxylating] n=1 Tax=Congregibacter litoralis KT71 TaxID=314285 RepID=A4A5I3_9GAMM|nr:carboxylating nicotinate-nucleotide diphosphorylase [Congregibacter litoralis]EAQ99054.1 nicotinate-nucleotide pyrophosphorylase (carboxylating) [Congregibacter litoralis KT71]
MTLNLHRVPDDIVDANVQAALAEDIGDGDITAELLPADSMAEATIVTRDEGVLCGQQWVNRVFEQVDDRIMLQWNTSDGDSLRAGQTLLQLRGPARGLLTAERTALNFLQTLSGTATRCREYAQRVEGTGVRLLDTRKTLPGLRAAQKYAVRCGGCHNHRVGLFDAFLIKENHILACGGIPAAVMRARENAPGKPVEVEVESMDELVQAIDAECERVMLDNFDLDAMREAVRLNDGRAELEASGNVTLETLAAIAQTGVDFISIGALTKGCEPLDLSMRLS